MRKFVLLLLVVFCLCAGANVGLAALSLGWWDEGAPGSTHEFWDFTPGYVLASGSGYTADPEVVNNPYPNRVAATITPMNSGSWDGISTITATDFIHVSLEIPNYEYPNPYTEIWVEVGNLVVSGVTVSATDGSSTTFTYEILPGQGNANFGIMITPNPYVEKIDFSVTAAGGLPDPATSLDYIDVDTICIPEPVTFVLFGLGALALRRRK